MTERRLAWFQLSSGVAGDMVLGSLLDAGASLDSVREILGSLPFDGWELSSEQVTRGGIAATRAVVSVVDESSSRTWASIRSLLEGSELPGRIRDRSLTAFAGLARVEAELHGRAVDDVHFHEVGGHDAIIDIVGVMAALEDLGIDEVRCSPVGLGHGSISSLHGEIPGPAPATARLLEGFEIVGVDLDIELATPTGAAIISSLCRTSTPAPRMTLEGHGLGAGSRDLDGRANVVGVIIGSTTAMAADAVALLETTLDDVTGEHLAVAVAALIERGALDAWLSPVTMKKGRPGFVLSCLCAVDLAGALTEIITRTTGTLGVRTSLVERRILDRRFVEVSVEGHPLRIKISEVRAKVELDDLVRVSAATGLSLVEVEERALGQLAD